MNLKKLLRGVPGFRVYGKESVFVKGIFDDSRKAFRGGVFVAIKGEHVDANDFIGEVIQKGAVAIVSEREPRGEWLLKASYVRVKDAREALGVIAGNWYGNPSKKLKVIGVTGSDGKTTTSHLIYEILKESGKKVGLISSIAARIGNISLDTGFHVTNPEPLDLQNYLSQMVENGTRYVVLETTSHGIAQKRIAGIDYDIAVMTNITHEHLDYHKTFEAYRDTKLLLFLNAKATVLNKDDESYSYFKRKIKGKIITYSISGHADVYASSISIKGELMDFDIHDARCQYRVVTKLIGDYNAQNILAAVCVAKLLRVSRKHVQNALAKADRPKGRLEKVPNRKGIDIYIDFAHTPNSLMRVLNLLKKRTRGKLIAVFGCAGERDHKKRPMMAKIATETADSSIFTAEDPRSEDINDIFEDMLAGVTKKTAAFVKVPERGEAIYYAINKCAKRGDTVVICGKAHEKSMAYNGVEYPWDDFRAVGLALSGKILKINRK